jgi:hypothetical protein
MSTEKLIHDLPFIIEAARRQSYPNRSGPEVVRVLGVDELMVLMERAFADRCRCRILADDHLTTAVDEAGDQ